MPNPTNCIIILTFTFPLLQQGIWRTSTIRMTQWLLHTFQRPPTCQICLSSVSKHCRCSASCTVHLPSAAWVHTLHGCTVSAPSFCIFTVEWWCMWQQGHCWHLKHLIGLPAQFGCFTALANAEQSQLISNSSIVARNQSVYFRLLIAQSVDKVGLRVQGSGQHGTFFSTTAPVS